MGRGIFITGTDTGVGKTFFACGLAASLRGRGYRVGVMKPAETGCARADGSLLPDDAARLKAASGCELPLEVVCPYALREPLAPSLAAERDGVRIEIDRIVRSYREIRAAHDVTLVEGAGGLMVPLLPAYTFADLAALLELPVIVVAANRLGAINHLLLTLEHASCKGLRVLGYVLNRSAADASLAAETNREALSTLTAVPCLGEIEPMETDVEHSLLAGRFEERLCFEALASVLD
ncbi:MAG TPA: dethiobiotin synthase [candidate division Zixibacteria bacterium]|nr:dethiobiotin synthase [candidate division Zixibacteria bacterium]